MSGALEPPSGVRDPGLDHTLEPPFGARDPGRMAELIEGAPRQIEQALARASETPWRLPVAAPDMVVAGAMGGSAIGADLVAALYSDRLPRPLLVVRDYRWPACVAPSALAVLASYSGGTEETLALYREAGARGIPRVAITTGGMLAAACERDGVSWSRLPAGMPPRAAVYASWVTWTFLLHALGWAPDPGPAWREAAALLRRRVQEWGVEIPEPHNRAKQLARALRERLVFFYGGSERSGPVAQRWRHQLNENAKLPAHSAVVPELDHNEIVGWERSGPVTDRAAAVLFRDAEDAPEVALRLALTGEFVGRQGVPVTELRETEGGRLARMVSLVHLGDFVSFYLAMLGGVDPTPIASIDAFKQRLKEEGARRVP